MIDSRGFLFPFDFKQGNTGTWLTKAKIAIIIAENKFAKALHNLLSRDGKVRKSLEIPSI